MKGTVAAINPRNGMVAILTEEGSFSLIDPIGGEFELRDHVSWSAHNPLGGDRVLNVTRGEWLDVFFENHYVTQHNLARLMGL